MRIAKEAFFVITFIFFSIIFLFSQSTPGSATSSKGTIMTPVIPVVPENKVIEDKNAIERTKAIKEKMEDIKINKNRRNDENLNGINNIKVKEKSYLNNFSDNLEGLQDITGSIKKNIKILNENDKIVIKEEYIKIKNNIDKLENENTAFLGNIDPEEKKLIGDQNNSIKKSLSNLQKMLNSIDKEFDKIKSNEDLFNKTVDIEKEIKNVSRQYRAIDWILFEQ
jgi:hypothetical protein